jgi:hypothetical protein
MSGSQLVRDMVAHSQLVRAIKAHIAKGDKAAEKSEQHYIAAGQHLKTLKAQMPRGLKWEAYLEELGIHVGRRRADELIQIADGRTSIAAVRERNADAAREHRERLALRNAEPETESIEENASPPEVGAEAMKARFAAIEQEAEDEDDDIETDINPESHRNAFLIRADQAVRFAVYSGPIDQEIVEATRAAVLAWTTLLQQIGRAAPPDDDIPEFLRRAPKAAAS